MAFEHPCGRKFTQLVSHHIFGNKHLVEHLSIVYQKRETHELRSYRTSSCPGSYWLTRAGSRLPVNLDKQLIVNVWSFFKRSSHFSYLVPCEAGYARFFYGANCFCLLLLRLRIILLLLGFRGFLVFPPFAGTPVGEQGCRPPFALPSPPPIGCATGFIAFPLT